MRIVIMEEVEIWTTLIYLYMYIYIFIYIHLIYTIKHILNIIITVLMMIVVMIVEELEIWTTQTPTKQTAYIYVHIYTIYIYLCNAYKYITCISINKFTVLMRIVIMIVGEVEIWTTLK
jgi:hypothetical protein